jgi:crotonobetainyl-CoA:carnitine CoA-transferase CaiB-like acyl-CoA transferase
MQLADLGAEVIKLEDAAVGGDLGRHVPPYASDGSSLYFESFNRGKRSVCLELRSDAGKTVFHDLVRRADVVFANVRGDVVERLGIGYRHLAPLNPAIVCCSLSGFGRTGPRADEGAYDHTIQAISGWQAITGEPDGPPTRSGVSVVDLSGGYAAAITILAAVLDARSTGLGADIDIALQEVAVAQLAYLATWSASRGYAPTRHTRSRHPSIAPFQTFAAADGWLVIACPKDGLWRRLCQAINRTDLCDDPRYSTLAARLENREDLVTELEAVLAHAPVDHWLRRLRIAGVPSAPVNEVGEALADAQLDARRTMISYDHPIFGTIHQPASPLRVSSGRAPARRAPFLGEHNDSALTSLCGYEPETITALAEAGAFGDLGRPEPTPSSAKGSAI